MLIKGAFFSAGNEILPAPMAYDEWAQNYDAQLEKGNLTVFYNDLLVEGLVEKVPLEGKVVCDFGAGTGKYYELIRKYQPERWIGCDVSQGMLNRLTEKIPSAEVYKLDDHRLPFLKDREVDVLFSSLTLGYILNVENVFNEWNRVLKPNGYILLSMFHPDFPNFKTARSFKNAEGKYRIIQSYRHRIAQLESSFLRNNWQILYTEELVIDEKAKPILDKMNKSAMYAELVGKPLIVGYVLRKE
jgi:ubiquinone/menaquinone biosynthesis C-methylase UbiE